MLIKNKGLLADLSLLITAVIWGGGFVGVKDALATVEPLHLMAIRFLASGILLGILFIKRLKNIKKKDIFAGFIVGLLLFAGFATQTIGMKYTTAGKNAFLTGLNVVIVPFIFWAIKKKFPGFQAIIAAVLAFIGIGLLSMENGSLNINFGDFMTILCAVFFAFQIVAIGYFLRETDSIVLVILQMIIAAILSIISAVLFEPKMSLSSININSIYSIGYLVIFATMVAFVIQNTAQKYTVPTHAAIILCMESVFGSIFSVIFLKENFTFSMFLGCVVIFTAIILSEVEFKTENREKRREKRDQLADIREQRSD